MARGRISFNGRSLPNVRNVVREQLTSMKIPNAVKEATDALKGIDIPDMKSLSGVMKNELASANIMAELGNLKTEFSKVLSSLDMNSFGSGFDDAEKIIKDIDPEGAIRSADMDKSIIKDFKDAMYTEELKKADTDVKFSEASFSGIAKDIAVKEASPITGRVRTDSGSFIQSMSGARGKLGEIKNIASPSLIDRLSGKIPELMGSIGLDDASFFDKLGDVGFIGKIVKEMSNFSIDDLGLDL